MLWYENGTSTPDLHFCQLPFSLKSSPAILNSIIQNHLASYKQAHPDVSRMLADSLYVDDFVGGVVSLQQGEEMFYKSQANNESGWIQFEEMAN